ncbi:MAG: redoxin domain-containing protein [Planctomycetota bacterium]
MTARALLASALLLLGALAPVRADDPPRPAKQGAAKQGAAEQGAAEPGAAKLGEAVGKLELTDTRYLPRTLDDLGQPRLIALVFTTVECPMVKRVLPRVVALSRELRPKGVQFLAVDVGPGDDLRAVATQALDCEADFPFVKDFSGDAIRRLGVDRTALVVVLDEQRRVRYRGRVDDQYRLGGVRPKATREDLRLALEELLAGKPVSVPETAVDGCRVAPPTAPPLAGAPPTWSEHVAPILYANCVSCHRQGTQAPFALLDYEKARANAGTIAEVVAQGRMPPWFASERHGSFTNHRGLSAAARETIAAWVRAGCPQGDPRRAPARPALPAPGAWEIGTPDLVLPDPSEQRLPAHGYVPYRYVILPHVFAADTWVTGVQIRPQNPRVLHHCNLAYVDVLDPDPAKAHFITGQVPGGEAMKLPEGLGFKIPQGAMLVLQIHYVTSGQAETDRISVGLRFARWPVQKQVHHIRVTRFDFEIPPGAPAHRVVASKAIPHDATGIALFSHMHLRGRDMTFTAVYPDRRRETLLEIPNYSFDWQLSYRLPPRKRFPKGTKLECVGHYDNSPWNPYNPDPSKAVRFGEQTYHEMFYGFFFYTDDSEQLDVRVDPQTGFALPQGPAPATPAPAAPKPGQPQPQPQPAKPGRRWF